jgi:outer membrane protein assembly factor BamE (lipoprotein component of BamABCDE complex)
LSLFNAGFGSANKFPTMTAKLLSCALASCVLWAAGCSTVDSRIAKNRELFNSWPGAVQEKIVVGQIDIGFTADQVRVALGDPDRVFTRTTADGTSQVWSYRDRGPRIGFGVGLGMGSFGGRGGTFGGVGIGTGGGYHDDEKLGIVFDSSGRVSSIETRK